MSPPSTLQPSIYLDYGTDAVTAEDAACEICERGMRFNSHWQFEIGSVLQIAFAFENDPRRRIEAEGLVIECCRTGEREYLSTLAFVDISKELRDSLGQVSRRLHFRPIGS
jgi:hypothetical protein